MFEKYYGFTENPFSLTPDPRFFFSSRSHDEALAHLRYWIEHRETFVMLSGEVGTGKTTVLFRLMETLDLHYETALVSNSTLSPSELLEEICRKFQLEVEQHGSKPALLQKLEAHFLRLSSMGHGVVVIIDEAQNFSRELLEEVRLLSNISRPGSPLLLQIALVGQPELERKLGEPALRQLRQRIALHHRITPMTDVETALYIHHRVALVRGDPMQIFPESTLVEVYRWTHGLPREINQVTSQALLHAYVAQSHRVEPEHVRSAVEEMNFQSVLDVAREPGESVAPSPAHTQPAPEPPSAPIASPPPASSAPTLGVVRDVSHAVGADGGPKPETVPPHPLPPPRPLTPPVTTPPRIPVTAPIGSTTAPTRPGPRSAPRKTGGTPPSPPSARRAPASPPPSVRPPLGGAWPKPPDVASGAGGESTQTPRLFGARQRPARRKGRRIPAPLLGATIGAAVLVLALVILRSRTQHAEEQAGGWTQTRADSVQNVTRQNATPQNGDRSTTAVAAGDALRGMPWSPYRLQVVSVTDSAAAVDYGRQLASVTRLHYDVISDRSRSMPWYAVVLGPFQTREAAEAARQKVDTYDRTLRGTIVRTRRPQTGGP
jgi:general secretion pathway protein A